MSLDAEPRRAMKAMMAPLGLCFIAVLAFGLGKVTGTLDPVVARRGVGAMIGFVLAVTGNFVPKLRLFQPAAEAADSAPVDRFAGWTFVTCGLAFSGAFVLAPEEQLFIVPPLIAAGGFIAVLARWLAWRGTQPGHATRPLTMPRFVLAMMLVTVLWVCAIFVSDAVWDDAVSQRVVLLFPLALAPVIAAHRAMRAKCR